MSDVGSDYLAFLEEQLFQEAGTSSPPHHHPKRSDEDESRRWLRAATVLEPRSRGGFLFGVSRRDIEHAVALLSGTAEFQTPVRALKRSIDFIVAGILLILLSPIFVAIALAIKLTSPGPAIFRQTRIGRGGHPFAMYKFRTMRVDAPQNLATVSDGMMFKLRNDPRVTPAGRWLRRSSLDELPQLVNVLLGHMSLVGPRPPLPSEVEQYDAYAGRRLLVPPGMTGLWQVSGRSDLSWEESMRLDLRYVEGWSLWRDLGIIRRTIRAVARGVGAY